MLTTAVVYLAGNAPLQHCCFVHEGVTVSDQKVQYISHHDSGHELHHTLQKSSLSIKPFSARCVRCVDSFV